MAMIASVATDNKSMDQIMNSSGGVASIMAIMENASSLASQVRLGSRNMRFDAECYYFLLYVSHCVSLLNSCQPLPTSILTVTSTLVVTPPFQRALEETARTLARLASSPKNIEKLYESGTVA